MQTTGPEDITMLIAQARAGDGTAAERLLPVLYDELRALAAGHLRRERPDHTLQTTALVHEAYLKLIDQNRAEWQDRNHFFAIAATVMRRILINHAKSRGRLKRGGDRARIPLDQAPAIDGTPHPDLLALDDAMTRLATMSERQARVVELRYFGGLSVEEVGQVLDTSPATVKRDWTLAKAWLHRELGANDDDA